ncbi:hypothetical protein ITJ86_11860 [Winogradskyella sp. F6397]|uniref:DUF2721 domain-containing protein n=1 Tax=Winogradskyella marina TaxID=2785530 RepID=A0ABS0ELY9_9FLAO|nr:MULTISPECIES: hypothetical protein [Winogradskyella]MBF8150597.1 hypothetical protein [Winogradskyella marina]
MENWYLPITIVPGLGLLILSTSNLMVTLSNEIDAMIENSKQEATIVIKLKQLKLLNMAMVFFYVAVALLLVSAVGNGLYTIDKASLYISVLAIIFALIGLISLIIYSFRAVSIRQNQFKNKQD